MERDCPWGSIAGADAHVHFFSQRFFEKLAGQAPGLTLEAMGAQLGWHMPSPEPEKLATAWAGELGRHGVARAALMASVPGDEESVVAAVRTHPDKFFAFAMVDPSSDWRPMELAQVQVACLFPAMHRYSIQSNEARGVFEWAQQGNRAVFVHCGVLSVG